MSILGKLGARLVPMMSKQSQQQCFQLQHIGINIRSFTTGTSACSIFSFRRSTKDKPIPSSVSDPAAARTSIEPDLGGAVSTITRGPLPLITGRPLEYVPPHRPIRQAWVENLDTIEETKLGLVDLHPDIFGKFPRIDILHKNVHWQRMYKHINWSWTPNRAELSGPSRKPWPQKGTGRARHGSRRSPLWYHGAKAHGPRGPRTYFFMLNLNTRILGLCTALSVKLAQDDLKIVDSLEIPSTEPYYLETLAKERSWGASMLFVDDTDLMPTNISLATQTIGNINLMPVYGLNVYSMLKHETLILTTAALDRIEEKLLFQMHRNDSRAASYSSRKPRSQVDLMSLSKS